MAKSAASSTTSVASTPSSSNEPTRFEGSPEEDRILEKLRKSREGEKMVGWINEQYTRSKAARQTKQLQWYTNLAYFFGKQYVENVRTTMPDGYRDQLRTPKTPYYKRKKTINRVRSFVRAEHSKFMSSVPSAIVVPSTAEDQDIRAAYAGEQAWKSISEAQKLRTHYSKAVWWAILTGNGFIKTYWDQSCYDKASGQFGAIKYSSVSPFHLFVPDLREQDIEDQPFVTYATIRTLEWCYTYYAKELQGITLAASVSSANNIVEEGHLNLSTGNNRPDACVVYETWIKPGASKLFPNGGVVIHIDNVLVAYHEGLPYNHEEYPFTKFEHIQNSTFYADSPLVDLNELQKDYNEIRTDIGEAARRMGKPQLLTPRGSLATSRLTNEAGLIIEYNPGMAAPAPLQLSPLPEYVVSQQDRILQDFEDLSGQHEVSKGTAPPGVTAGTAIAYLQEKDDQYLTSQYKGIEDGYEKIAGQTLSLFVQMVDTKRKIKIVGADGAFDTLMLSGSDLKDSTDVRVEGGSAIGQSKAANDARVMDMFAMGIIDQPTALRLIEIGGSQKVLDIMHVAERKAQRENIKMKMLTPELIEQHNVAYEQMAMQAVMEGDPTAFDDSTQSTPGLLESPDPDSVNPADMWGPPGIPPAPPVVQVDDFDVHEIHIDAHNKFRMSQEYEALPDEVKEQFNRHVQIHTQMLQQKQMMSFLNMIPSDGSDGSIDDGNMDVMTPGAPEDMMAANGAVPDQAPKETTSEAPEGGEPNG